MKNIKQALTGLIWSVDKLQSLIPDGPEWDRKAQTISEHRLFAQKELDFLDCQQYPYEATFRNGMSFVPTMIDFDCRLLWHQKSQVSGDGEWVSMDDVTLKPNPYFQL